MASIKLILRKRANKDGTHPIALQVTKDRKRTVLYVGHTIKMEEWDAKNQCIKKTHPNSTRLNNLLAKKVAEARGKLMELEIEGKDTSVRVIGKAVKGSKEGTFLKLAHAYIDNLKKEGKFNRISADSPVINRVKEFAQGDINFSEIDPAFLKRFKAWLIGSRGVSERTAINHYVVIRSLFNQAINAGLVDRKHYPFGKGKVSIKFPDNLKQALTADEVALMEKMELDELENHSRQIWLLSFYFAGMRISDVLKLQWSDLKDGRLTYQMAKNLKGGSLKVPEKAARLLETLKRENEPYVFNDLDGVVPNDKYAVQFRIKSRLHEINKYLKRAAQKAGIEKKLTMHISRHTFAHLSGDKIAPAILQRLYRHSSILTTMSYQKGFIHKDTDDALDAVLGQ